MSLKEMDDETIAKNFVKIEGKADEFAEAVQKLCEDFFDHAEKAVS